VLSRASSICVYRHPALGAPGPRPQPRGHGRPGTGRNERAPASSASTGIGDACSVSEAVRKIDIAHSGQTVSEAMEQLEAEVKNARRGRESVLLVIHGFGASGVGGAIKTALDNELPRLARLYGFKAYGYADKQRLPRRHDVDSRSLNPGSTVLVFRLVQSEKDPSQEFRPNFRTLRSKVRVRVRAHAPAEDCQHVKGQVVSRGPSGSSYKCRLCGKTFVVPNQG
jgi:hypothetical protein